MKRLLVVGAGRQGRYICNRVVEEGIEVEAWDIVEENLSRLKPSVKRRCRNFLKESESLGNFPLVVDALPGSAGYHLMECAVGCGVDVISISFTDRNVLDLDKIARGNRSLIIPDAGLAPGIGSLLAGYGYSLFNGAEKIIIKVGGLPRSPVPPFNYAVTWSVEDLIDEYMRPARVKVGGSIIEKEPVTEIVDESIPGFENLESFITDGLRTMLYTLPVSDMEERTIRYRGHGRMINLLKQIGLFSSEEVDVDGMRISPRRFLGRVFEKYHSCGDDVVILQVEVFKGEKSKVFRIVELAREGFSAMVRTTATPVIALVSMWFEGYMNGESGVIPLEIWGQNRRFTERFIQQMRKYGINIEGG